MKIHITISEKTLFFGNDTKFINISASMDKYHELLETRIKENYPQAKVIIEREKELSEEERTRQACISFYENPPIGLSESTVNELLGIEFKNENVSRIKVKVDVDEHIREISNEVYQEWIGNYIIFV